MLSRLLSPKILLGAIIVLVAALSVVSWLLIGRTRALEMVRANYNRAKETNEENQREMQRLKDLVRLRDELDAKEARRKEEERRRLESAKETYKDEESKNKKLAQWGNTPVPRAAVEFLRNASGTGKN